MESADTKPSGVPFYDGLTSLTIKYHGTITMFLNMFRTFLNVGCHMVVTIQLNYKYYKLHIVIS